MMRAIMVVAALALLGTDATAASKREFKAAPEEGTVTNPRGAKPRNTNRFKSVPVPVTEPDAESTAAPAPATAGGVGPGWLPPRPDAPAELPAAWAEFLDRCLISVATLQPLDTTGLAPADERVIEYEKAYTRQSWTDAAGDIGIEYRIEAGYANQPRRDCWIRTAQGREQSADASRAIDAGFVSWAYGMMDVRAYDDVQHPDANTPEGIREGDAKYMLQTIDGNARGCMVRVLFDRMFFGDAATISIRVHEDMRKPCDRKHGNAGAG